jgi:hypothetical protein
MANDDDDDGEFSPMPPLALVANVDEHWREIFSPLSSFGSLEQEGGEMKMNTLSRMMMMVKRMTVE